MHERIDVAGALVSLRLTGQGTLADHLPNWSGISSEQDPDVMWAGLLALRDRKAEQA